MIKFMGTAGPWVAVNGLTSGREVVGRKPRGGDYVVARCGGKDREANARLIAAAPELLEALQDAKCTIQALIDEGYSGYIDQRERIDRILAKAIGEDAP